MTSIEEIKLSYGINKAIDGEYDKTAAAKCANGTFVGKRFGDVVEFRGIPFAKPPVGDRRWKRPAPVDDCDGVFTAFYNGKTPVQTILDSERASYYKQGEDCLYLNIWMNKACDMKNKTVMVFFHGGSYGWGGTADPLYDGKNFVRANPDIVLVTVGYRVGLFGFVDLSYVKGGENFPDAPNLGLLDQIEALRWVQRNIHAFSGNPKNVTIFGESAGGGSVSLLPIIREAKGLFHRVIAQSGSVALSFSEAECRDYTLKLIKGSGMGSMDELMSLSEEEIIDLNTKLNLDNNFPQRDGKLISLNPYDDYYSGVTSDVDMLIGTNANELNYWIGELGGIVPFRLGIPVKFENDLRTISHEDKKHIKKFMSSLNIRSVWKIAEFYNEVMFRLPAVNQAQLHAQSGGNAYMYYFKEPSAIKFRGACHAVELAYVFGNIDETIYTGKPADKQLSDTVMKMWANFARTGNPSVVGINWKRYTVPERATMILDKNPRLKNDILKNQRKLLFPLLRYMINASYTSLDYNVPFVRKVVAGAAAAAIGTAVGIVALRKLFKD